MSRFQEEFPFLGFGLGFRERYKKDILEGRTRAQWFEALTENYLGFEGVGFGPPLKRLEKLREKFPVVLHCVSMSLGSNSPLNESFFKRFKTLIDIIEPAWVSDHLCWTGVHGKNTHDLLPLPYTPETVDHVSKKILKVQDILQRPILIENVSSYMEFKNSEMSESEFILEITKKSGCHLLLDVNNIFVSSHNHHQDYKDYLKYVPWDKVTQIHLAGPSPSGELLIDTHDHPVHDKAWEIYREVVTKAPQASVMVEWDDNFPEFSVVEAELAKAQRIHEEIHGPKVAAASPA